MRRHAPHPGQSLEVEGNNGGSYVRITKLDQEGFCYLEVGETCIRTISQVISVTALAAILTQCKNIGIDALLEKYFEHGGGSPQFRTDVDRITGKWKGG